MEKSEIPFEYVLADRLLISHKFVQFPKNILLQLLPTILFINLQVQSLDADRLLNIH